ncbi:RecX family transcriptional regulator [Orenia marismortui]|uniref:RecX family transcriptional regulator n=1 Tax=Orenia marismortui TaxID=46469 RepID=UPI00037C562E|nr:RecX family transcriptional regulator [Orenia marismortui]
MSYIGQITKIEAQKNNQGRCSIFLDGQFLVGVDAEIVYKFNLEKGHKLTEDILEHILDQEDFIQAKKAAFNLLSYRQRSYKEMKDRLAKKGFDEFIIEQVIRILERLDYIDDREFANAWIKDRITRRYGPWVIKMQLKEKGVKQRIIEEELDREYNSDLQYKIAQKLAAKKVKRYRKLDDWKKRGKLSKFLQRKGFSFDIINLVLKDLINN